MATTVLALAVVVAFAHLVGSLADRLDQPRVVGELIAGLVLGPSVLGALAPQIDARLFPPEVVDRLAFVGELGLVLFVTSVGLAFDGSHLRRQGRTALAVSLVSILVPFALGVGIAPWVRAATGEGTDPAAFALFMGAAMAITAFPVLVRILDALDLTGTRLGTLVVACAGVDDVVAWVLLSVAVAVATSAGALGVLGTVVASVLLVGAVLLVLRPLLARLPRVPLAVAVSLALGGAWLSDLIGVSVILGAFLVGAALPRGEAVERVERQLGPVTRSVLLPVFFVIVGRSTELGSLDGPGLWLLALAVLVVASLGKLGGAAVAARVSGESWPDALGIGSLMNARGLTEVVVLTVGLELGVIGTATFTIMVLMALVTTVAAGPLARWFVGPLSRHSTG